MAQKYELTVLLEAGLKKKEKEDLLKKIKSWVESAKGKVIEQDEWGVRETAYPLQGKAEALYYFFIVEAEEDLNKILAEQADLEDKLLRFLVVKTD